MTQATYVTSKSRKSLLLGTSALVCFALAAPVMADDFVITSGNQTNAGNTINGNDTVTVTGALVTTEVNGIETTGGTNTVSVSGTGSIETTGDNAHGVLNSGNENTTTVSGSITTTGNRAWGIANYQVDDKGDELSSDSNETTVSGSITTAEAGANGIYNYGKKNITTVSGAGSIKTVENDANGIYNLGDGNATTVSGSIATGDVDANTGNGAVGIFNLGSGNITTVSGTGSIETEGKEAHGFFISGSKNTTTLLGSIETAGYSANGIWNQGKDNKTTVSGAGSIKTTGDNAHGVLNSGNENTTTVSGSITTTGNRAWGIANYQVDDKGDELSSDSNETTVSGSITTAEAGANGIYNYGKKNITTVSGAGSITTTGDGAAGVIIKGDNNQTVISGNITTSGVSAIGIRHFGCSLPCSNKATLIGTITTKGDYSTGIQSENFFDGDEAIVSKGGSIKTKGYQAMGIWNMFSKNVTTVAGSIMTEGNGAHGINSGSNNITTVSGEIMTEGNRAHGLFNVLGGNIASISGTVSATGTGSSALYNGNGSGNSFTLNEGAVIIGDISATSFSTNNKLNFNLGASSSYAYTVGGGGAGTGAGQWTFTDQDGSTQGVTSINTSNCTAAPDYDGDGVVIVGSSIISACNLVTGVSTGNLEVQDELQFSMNSSMIGSLSLGSNNSTSPVEAMSFAQTPQSSTWFNIYGDTSERSASTTKLAFDGSNRGLTIGTPVAINDTLNLDVVFNASNADLDIRSAKEQEIAAVSYNIGAVLRDLVPSDAWSVDAFGFLGSNSYEGKRKVMNNLMMDTGSETVTAAYSGMEVLLGVDAQYSNPINDTLNFTGGLNASLSNEKIGAYSESKYFSWDARTMTQAAGGINLGLEYNKDALTTFASLGLQHSSLQKGKTATYTNNGTAGSFIDNATSDTRRSATVGFSYKATENIAFKGAVEAFTSENGVDGNSANLSVNWKF